MSPKSILKTVSTFAAALSFSAAAHAAALAHWTFDATAGGDKNIYPDAVGNFPATPENKDLVSVFPGDAPFGKAVLLNGQDKSYLNTPFLKGFQRNSFTITAWVNIAGPGHNYILADWYGPDYAFLFGVDQAKPGAKLLMVGELRSATNKQKATAVVKLTSTREVFPNEWHHVAWVWKKTDATHGMIYAYIDGEERGKKTELNAQEVQNNNRIAKIGYKQDSKAAFNGAIDELWVFSDALTPDQVKNVMRYNNLAGTGTLARGLIKKDDDTYVFAKAASPQAAPPKPAPTVAANPNPTPPAVMPNPATPPDPAVVTPTDPNPPAPAIAANTGDTADVPETVMTTSDPEPPASPSAIAITPSAIPESSAIVAVRRGYTSGRIAGIVTCLTLVVALSSFLFWAMGERSKMRRT